MPGNQGLINIARGEAQRGESNDALAQDQAVSDRESSPNHRLQVTKATRRSAFCELSPAACHESSSRGQLDDRDTTVGGRRLRCGRPRTGADQTAGPEETERLSQGYASAWLFSGRRQAFAASGHEFV